MSVLRHIFQMMCFTKPQGTRIALKTLRPLTGFGFIAFIFFLGKIHITSD